MYTINLILADTATREALMLTYEECLDLCDISEGEVSAIAEHEHIDPMIAMAMGQYLSSHNGEHTIRRIIIEDIEHAEQTGNKQKIRSLRRVLEHFLATHPEQKAPKKYAETRSAA